MLKRLIKNMTFNFLQESKHKLFSQYPGVNFGAPENIKIGERVSIGSGAFLRANAPITIGSDTMIAMGVVLETSTHNHENNPMWKEQVVRPIEIGKHVWIGINAIILPGIKIGNYAVVGAGSVVTRHVPERAIVAGNPARVIKYRDLHREDKSVVYPGIVCQRDFLSEDFTMKKKAE